MQRIEDKEEFLKCSGFFVTLFAEVVIEGLEEFQSGAAASTCENVALMLPPDFRFDQRGF
jgi:hypothetical protein